jgi:hypothetical protein
VEYLFGDASPSQLDRNYIEYLRDLLDFAVAMLGSHVTATKLQRDVDDRASAAALVQAQLHTIGERLEATLQDLAGADTTTVAAQALEGIRAGQTRELRRFEQDVLAGVEREQTKTTQAVAAERAQNHARLEKLLLKHDLPKSSHWVSVSLDPGGAYAAKTSGRSRNGVSWVMALAIPSDHLFAQLVRVDRLMPLLAVKLPQESGWVRKSVKLRSYKLAKEVVTEVSFAAGSSTIKLRAAPQEDAGYDIVRNAKTHGLAVQRVGKGVEIEPYEPDPEDSQGLMQLWNELTGAAAELRLSRRGLLEARFEATPVGELADPTELVHRLVAQVGPIIRAIAQHSLSPTELVLKRVLADDRREEIFASKVDLLEKLAPLPPKLYRLFGPLGLDDTSEPVPSQPGAGSAPAPTPSSPGDTPGPEAPTRLVSLPLPSTPPAPRRPRGPGHGDAPSRPSAPTPPAARDSGAGGGPVEPRGDGAGPFSDSVEVPLDELEKG